ncbi:Hypothetical_protein [Hexamita inflata]|uniref:Hypothetical_protein n=1 Tax=Hexamita inflata TaxID=28002 RepID=A0AA86TRD1_9EUKA|nr:Hypothetical protein HINF_LOCUS11492 [Hexamita inflata]
MTNCSLPTYNFFWFTLYFVSDSAATQFYPQLLNVKISCMQIAQNQTFDVQLSISTIKSSAQFFSDILFIRSYANSITRHPSVVWCSRSISAMVTPTVFQIDILKYQNVCFSSSLDPLDIKRYLFISNNNIIKQIMYVVACLKYNKVEILEVVGIELRRFISSWGEQYLYLIINNLQINKI